MSAKDVSVNRITDWLNQNNRESRVEPDRTLDATIAETIFHWEWWRSSSTNRRCLFAPGTIPRSSDEWFLERATGDEGLVFDWPPRELPFYSTDISAAFSIIDKLIESGIHSLTLDTYSHALEESKRDAIDMMDSILSNNRKS